MYKSLLTCLSSAALTLEASGQGSVMLDNFSAVLAPVRIASSPGGFNLADGAPGDYVGSNYTASLFFVNGTVTSQTAFDSLIPILVRDALFFGTTGAGPGHGINGDGSGFFDGGQARLVGQADFNVTVQVRAWYNGGGAYTSYAEAMAAGHNAGQSSLLSLYAAPPPGPAVPLTGLQPFTVGIPEPSTILLSLLASAALLLFGRRRKNVYK